MTGFICLDKSEGVTSFSAVNAVRRITGERKAGHTGTLDPMATGVLPVALGKATRFIGLLPDTHKSYDACFITGIRTDTLDITGTILQRSGTTVTLSQITDLLPRFTGDIMQTPPMYSAKKQDGVRLYELARRGIETEREPVPVTVYELIAGEAPQGAFTLSVSCSAGTYIRSIIDDIGRLLGCGAAMTALRRTRSNGFTLDNAFTEDELKALSNEGELCKAVIPADAAFFAYPRVTVTQPQAVRFSNGGELSLDRLPGLTDTGLHRVYSPEEVFLGLGEASAQSGLLTVKRVFTEG